MSLDASRWAWLQPLGSTDKLLLLALADRASDDNTCWPSYERLQQDTGLHRNTISASIKRLEATGVITKTRRKKTSSLYQLNGVPDRHENTAKYTSGRNKDKGNLGSTNTVLKGSTKSVLDPVQKAYEGSHSFGTGTYQEPTNKENLSLNPMSTEADYAVTIFNYWVSVMDKNSASTKLTPKRKKALNARLKDGYAVNQIKTAIDNCRADPWSMGANDRNTPFNDIELICRTGEKLESFISKPIAFTNDPKVNKNIKTTLEWMDQRA